ncbi:MAG: LysR substrate-binding domain-containing protein [Pseudomonadota bacterium]|nr:LysR substrate-binding domain-containing protein [Pseudomonadota bacterium]
MPSTTGTMPMRPPTATLPAADDKHAPDTWPDAPLWVAGGAAQRAEAQPVLPLVLFPHGCVFRAHALAQLQALGHRWRLAYSCPNVAGVLAAVQAGLGVSLLSRHTLPPGHGLRLLDAASGLPPPPATRLVLRAGPEATGATARAVLAR